MKNITEARKHASKHSPRPHFELKALPLRRILSCKRRWAETNTQTLSSYVKTTREQPSWPEVFMRAPSSRTTLQSPMHSAELSAAHRTPPKPPIPSPRNPIPATRAISQPNSPAPTSPPTPSPHPNHENGTKQKLCPYSNPSEQNDTFFDNRIMLNGSTADANSDQSSDVCERLSATVVLY